MLIKYLLTILGTGDLEADKFLWNLYSAELDNIEKNKQENTFTVIPEVSFILTPIAGKTKIPFIRLILPVDPSKIFKKNI